MDKIEQLTADFKDALWIQDEEVMNAIVTSNIKATFYESAWVNIDAWDSFSSVAGKVCKESYSNSPFIVIKDLTNWNFRWPRWFNYTNLPEWYTNTLAPDWVWTKPILYESLADEGGFENAAHDIVAMTADDIARYGWLATVFTSILDTQKISWREEEYKNMLLELSRVAKKQNFVILNWETAELPDCVATPNKTAKTAFNWAASMSWVYHPDRMITW
jgi:phosphoribosylaminoimidazole (AIR) synthetase